MTINFLELVKRLKYAGFPQYHDGTGNWIDDETGMGSPEMFLSSSQKDFDLRKCSYVPSLAELIKACGDQFSHLSRYELEDNIIWAAFQRTSEIAGKGKTPEEAVALLWLVLNEKHD